MNFLTLENVSKSFGEKVLFSNIALNISKGQKIALVAKNGSGKSTLLKVISGDEAAEGEHAKVLLTKGTKVGFLEQAPDFYAEHSVLEAALDSDQEDIRAIKAYQEALLGGDDARLQETLAKVEDLKAWNIEVRIKEILGKFNIKDLSQKVGTLSGGQKKRIALAKLIIDNPDLLILDEPTNHLDIDMIEWLEKYLSTSNITLLMVTHDRYFLERVCNEIIELDDGHIYTYRGNYTDYLEKKNNRIQNDQVVQNKTKKLYKKELDWIRRQPKARTTKSKSRVDKFFEIKEKAHKQVYEGEVTIEIDMERLGSKILECHAVTKHFDELKIIESFSYKFKKGEKVGLAGPNGVGKSTFINVLTKTDRPNGGKVVVGDTVVFGYYNQDGLENMPDKRVLDVIRDIAEYIPLKKGKKLTAESLLERFLFPRSQQQVFTSKLSGGEKRRLHLLTVLMANPNFLILDEPTNDLDILTLNVLEDYLIQYKGCVLIASHDRYFMDKIVDHLFIMEGEGKIKDFNGTYSEYKARPKDQTSSGSSDKKQKSTDTASTSDSEGPRKLTYFEKQEYNKIEADLARMEKKKKEIENKFLDPEITPDQITSFSNELGQLNKDIAAKEDRWLELSEFA